MAETWVTRAPFESNTAHDTAPGTSTEELLGRGAEPFSKLGPPDNAGATRSRIDEDFARTWARRDRIDLGGSFSEP